MRSSASWRTGGARFRSGTMKKLSWGIAIAFALVLVAMLGLSRYRGVVLQGAGGRAIG